MFENFAELFEKIKICNIITFYNLISIFFSQFIQCSNMLSCALYFSYKKSSRFGSMGYEEEYLRYLQDLLADVERRIKKGQSRLQLNNSQAGVSNCFPSCWTLLSLVGT